jgi:heptosyltransferase I
MTPSTGGSPAPLPESICVIRLSAIGDCCHTLPVLRTIQAVSPATRITWVIGTTEHALMEGVEV